MRILFVCMANSCRSQMAEAWARHLLPADWKIASAGLITHPVSRRARAVMAEVGVGMAGQTSKSIDSVDIATYDLVVTFSREAARYLKRQLDPERHLHRPVVDPMSSTGTPDEVRDDFRRARDEIRAVVAGLAEPPGPPAD